MWLYPHYIPMKYEQIQTVKKQFMQDHLIYRTSKGDMLKR